MKFKRAHSTLAFAFTAIASLILPTFADTIPAALPAPDGKPGDATKPVKVYILAGQSNMVGMGEVDGARNMYTGVFLTSDPVVPKEPLRIAKSGTFNILPVVTRLADGTETDKPLAEGLLEVPQDGVYQIHPGSANMTLDGKPTAGDVPLEAGKRYPFKLSNFEGAPPRFWMEKMDLVGHGDLESTVKRDGKFPWLVDAEGNWAVRNDVYFQEARVAEDGKGSALSATSNGSSIGPELGFGYVMGTFHGEQVLLIKTAMGNRALGFDFRPPSSGRKDPESEWESLEYKLMIEGVRKTLAKIDKVIPGYKGQGYEMTGFVWWQGHKDSYTPEGIADYEKNLTNLINDVRKEFKAPKMLAVVGTVGFNGYNMSEDFMKIHDAQMAVGDPKKHPEFAGNVVAVDTRDYWREVDESPANQDFHYNRNAETYLRVGDALGRAMVALQGGKAEPLPQGPRPQVVVVKEEDSSEPSAEQIALGQKALVPIIMEGIAKKYVTNPKNAAALASEISGKRPKRVNQFLDGAIEGLINCYHVVGIHDYDWHAFGPDLRDQKWDYFSFEPKETLPKEAPNRYRKVSYPKGMENWFAMDFEAAKAGWKSGLPPFGQRDGKLEPLGGCNREKGCGCGETPRTLWENEVILTRGTFDIPALKDGYRYRLVIGSSYHVNTGEGYEIYVNGKLLAKSNKGVGKKQGAQARGGHIFSEFRDDFKGGKVTIAVTSFLKYNTPRAPIPPSGHLTVWIEEQMPPPLEVSAISH